MHVRAMEDRYHSCVCCAWFRLLMYVFLAGNILCNVSPMKLLLKLYLGVCAHTCQSALIKSTECEDAIVPP